MISRPASTNHDLHVTSRQSFNFSAQAHLRRSLCDLFGVLKVVVAEAVRIGSSNTVLINVNGLPSIMRKSRTVTSYSKDRWGVRRRNVDYLNANEHCTRIESQNKPKRDHSTHESIELNLEHHHLEYSHMTANQRRHPKDPTDAR